MEEEVLETKHHVYRVEVTRVGNDYAFKVEDTDGTRYYREIDDDMWALEEEGVRKLDDGEDSFDLPVLDAMYAAKIKYLLVEGQFALENLPSGSVGLALDFDFKSQFLS